jgi:phage gp36-like protein
MAYVTKQQMIDRFGADRLVQLTNRSGDPLAPIDDQALNRAIADAGARIDGYLMGRYTLPLAATPDLILAIALDLSFHLLHVDVVPNLVQSKFDDALRALREIAAGTIQLNLAGAAPAQGSSGSVETNEPARPLSADSMAGFI